MASNILARRTLSAHGVELRGRDQQRGTRDRQTMQRTIIKQGYLKKLPNASRLGSSLKKVERRWFIFGVMGHTDPYLEYYENEDSIFGSRPLNIIFLDTCYKITRDQKTSRFINIFTLVLKERQLSLVAPTRDAMFEWSRAIEGKLCNLGFIESSSHGSNDYIRLPMERRYPEERNVPPPERHYLEVRNSGSSFPNVEERDYLEVRASGSNFPNVPFALDANGQNENTVETEVCYGNVPTTQHTTEVCEDTYDLTISRKAAEDASVYMIASPAAESIYMNVTKSATDAETTDAMLEMASSSVLSAAASDEQLSSPSVQSATSAKPLFSSPSSLPPTILVSAHADTPSATSSILHNGEPVTEQSTVQSPVSSPSSMPSFSESSEMKRQNRRSVPFHLPSYDEAMTSPDEGLSRYGDSRFTSRPLPASGNTSSRCLASSTDTTSSNGELSTNCASGISEFPPSPPPYSLQKVLFKGANLPLKQIQVQRMMEEMSNPQGIQVIIPKNQCQHSIAFTDCFSKIWISGWNQRTCPTFHSLLHIGDQLIAINGVAPSSRVVAKKMLKTCSGKTDATLTIRRIPCGRVIAIRKDSPVESLGVTVVNGTAEVGCVDPTGLARESGLEEKAPAMTGISGSGSWWITEINHQPLNLFYKDDEAKHRLNAMGNHISFVVQPTHLIVEMKKQLKNSKGFRDFLVQ